ncbi:Xaa-Pro peptidase family protein [Robbsia sp. Bb-Pol-6]|uniref:Xaa-Pro peptidase family protein n=1 Tax=Robbsia betulipollinis TaxID=2981849 RepID=A0ABT3ZNR8_9BURK|nr:Xaa-Pro peptidase family protein [Robbsia betulipollinis]MCY0388196.1 Xaa-Pro peptidase family protein [Robbsia betulipollinis]
MPVLTRATHAHRLTALRAMMAREQLDAVVLTGADFFQWASNFHVDVQTWERPILLCVTADGASFAVMNELSTHHLRFARERGSLWLDDITLYAEHPQGAGRQPLITQLPELVAERLTHAGLRRARIGYDALNAPLSRALTLLPEARLLAMTADLRALRWVKQPEELAVMRAAADLSDWVQERYRENFRVGRLTAELDAQMASLMVEEAARRFPGEHLEILRCWTLAGPAASSPHGDGASCGARIGAGDVIINLVIPRLNGIVIENERTWFCGRPSDEQKRFYRVALDANEAALDAAVTGRPVSGIDAAAQAVIEQAGCAAYIRHRTGHGMGIMGHEFPEDMAFNHRALLENEVYSAEPGIYVYGLGGFRIDDTVVVGDVPEVLTRAPKTLDYVSIG